MPRVTALPAGHDPEIERLAAFVDGARWLAAQGASAGKHLRV